MTDTPAPPSRYIAFAGSRRVASGSRLEVALRLRAALDRGLRDPVLVFDARTSEPLELDLRGSAQAVTRRMQATAVAADAAQAPPRPRPGRPRLGVVAREVTLLPRHWQWLAEQPGGASAMLRRLVEEARRANAGKDAHRRAQESAYRFMQAMAGDLPGFEEAVRALYRGDAAQFRRMIAAWPRDLRLHAQELAARAFDHRDSGNG